MYVDQPDSQASGERSLARSGASGFDLLVAAQSGQLGMEQATGEAVIAALTLVEEQVERMGQQVLGLAAAMPLGGGYAEEISLFNQRLAVGGPNSAEEVLDAYTRELAALKEATRLSMVAYEETDAEAVRRVDAAGGEL